MTNRESGEIKSIIISKLKDLVKEGLIRERDLSGDTKKMLNPNFTKFYPEYVITNQGMMFLNNIEVRNLSKTIAWLTKILILFGAITIFLMIWQIILQYRAFE